MTLSDDQLARLRLPEFPRSARYDPVWQVDNQMGPNALWLAESLSELLELPAGGRVLDLGCGRAISSIFLAREFGVQVVAADLWIDATDNWRRIVDAGLADQILPINAEAHDLPFAHGYFDAIVSYDAYHYFGTADLYLPSLLPYLRPGGRIGVVVPAVTEELVAGRPPEHLLPYWQPDFRSFHTPQWWRQLWCDSGQVDVEAADLLPDGARHWRLWTEVTADTVEEQWRHLARRDAEMLATDDGRALGFTRIVARKTSG